NTSASFDAARAFGAIAAAAEPATIALTAALTACRRFFMQPDYTMYNLSMRRLTLFFSLLLCVELSARQPVRARHAMVVAQEPIAADVGLQVLKNGGNAVDAAVAVGFALAVTYPYAGNLGGGGFMLIHFANGQSTFIDFRERAPEKASHDMYLDANGKT